MGSLCVLPASICIPEGFRIRSQGKDFPASCCKIGIFELSCSAVIIVECFSHLMVKFVLLTNLTLLALFLQVFGCDVSVNFIYFVGLC